MPTRRTRRLLIVLAVTVAVVGGLVVALVGIAVAEGRIRSLGQFIYVVPDKHLVTIRFGDRQWTPLLRSVADAAPAG